MIRVLLFVVVPIAELALLAVVGDAIGFGWLALVVLVTAALGARLVVRQGRLAWRDLVARLEAGQVPTAEVAHGAMILVGGVLLIAPGLLTDLCGALLMVPWFRELVRVRFFTTIRTVVL